LKTREEKKKILEKFFGSKLEDNLDLFSSGKLDSLKVVELIIFLEKKLKKKIKTSKINQKTFSTIKNIIKIL